MMRFLRDAITKLMGPPTNRKCPSCSALMTYLFFFHDFASGYHNVFECVPCKAYWSDRWPEKYRAYRAEYVKRYFSR